jgi:hypothetical protein
MQPRQRVRQNERRSDLPVLFLHDRVQHGCRRRPKPSQRKHLRLPRIRIFSRDRMRQLGKFKMKDWPEDFSHENGNYSNLCSRCGAVFQGYKRRVTCRECVVPGVIQNAHPSLPIGLRALRLHHWRKVLLRRKQQVAYEKINSVAMAQQCREIANFHLGQVQLLNEFFYIGDTAEIDAEEKEGNKNED